VQVEQRAQLLCQVQRNKKQGVRWEVGGGGGGREGMGGMGGLGLGGGNGAARVRALLQRYIWYICYHKNRHNYTPLYCIYTLMTPIIMTPTFAKAAGGGG
jgi:hypothetical protein